MRSSSAKTRARSRHHLVSRHPRHGAEWFVHYGVHAWPSCSEMLVFATGYWGE